MKWSLVTPGCYGETDSRRAAFRPRIKNATVVPGA